MTNWLVYEFGTFHQSLGVPDPSPRWQSEGTVSIDPNAVIAVSSNALLSKYSPSSCCIVLTGNVSYSVPKSRDSVIADLQSARDD